MAEYIEREALLKAYLDLALAKSKAAKARKGVAVFQGELYPMIEITEKEWVRLINAAPAADVVEVKHGRWEWREEWDTDEVAHTATLKSCGWYCTECGIELGDYLTKETGERHFIDDAFFTPCLKHCPNCGARMDGDG